MHLVYTLLSELFVLLSCLGGMSACVSRFLHQIQAFGRRGSEANASSGAEPEASGRSWELEDPGKNRWVGKAGSICHFAFFLVLQCLGVARCPDAGKSSTKSAIVTPLLVCAPSASKSSDLRAVSPDASRQSTGKMINRPHFAHIQGGIQDKGGTKILQNRF